MKVYTYTRSKYNFFSIAESSDDRTNTLMYLRAA